MRCNEGRIFTPFKDDKPVLWKPLAAVNWPPSSYDPTTYAMYICATDSLWGAEGGDPEYPVEPGAGGLVFVGRNDGRITALDSSSGRRLWEFQTDGGVNAPSSTFLHEGKQYLAVYAGGTSLAGSERSDGVWLFALDGTLQSLPRDSADPGTRATAAPLTTTTLTLAELMTTISNGREQMPAFGRVYEPEDLHDVAAYILDRFVDRRGVE